MIACAQYPTLLYRCTLTIDRKKLRFGIEICDKNMIRLQNISAFETKSGVMGFFQFHLCLTNVPMWTLHWLSLYMYTVLNQNHAFT